MVHANTQFLRGFLANHQSGRPLAGRTEDSVNSAAFRVITVENLTDSSATGPRFQAERRLLSNLDVVAGVSQSHATAGDEKCAGGRDTEKQTGIERAPGLFAERIVGASSRGSLGPWKNTASLFPLADAPNYSSSPGGNTGPLV